MKINYQIINPTYTNYMQNKKNSAYFSVPNYSANFEIPAFLGNYYSIEKTELNKAKLLKTIDKYLGENNSKKDNTHLTQEEIIQLKLDWLARVKRITERHNISKQKKFNELAALIKQGRKLTYTTHHAPSKTPRIPSNIIAEKTDLTLLNKFKIAVESDNLNLDKVFLQHYKDMKTISTIDELRDKYPVLELPQRPEKVVAKKIADNLTLDFYEEMSDIPVQDTGKAVNDNVTNILESYAEHYKVTSDKFGKEVHKELQNQIHLRLESYKNGTFNPPQFRKKPFADITGEDFQLLSVDFDDFVSEVTKRQYLGNEKLKDIVYDNGTTKIKAGSLIDNRYKFTKVSEKIKSIIRDANIIKNDSRKYEKYSTEQLRNRLEYYGSKDIANNEIILQAIIDFGTCNFEKDDIEPMIKFFRELDMVLDGDKIVDEAAKEIYKKNLFPHGTRKSNDIERQEFYNKVKAEQEANAKLEFMQGTFDDAINTLYINDMADTANLISKYRPKNLDDNSAAEFITNLIKQQTNTDNTIENTHLLECQLKRWQKYKEAPFDKSMQEAIRYSDGDPIKAGQYLINREIIMNFPEIYHPDMDIVEEIIQRTGKDKNSAIQYLCKLDEYYELDDAEGAMLTTITNLFSHKDPVEKSILKHIFENEYLNSSTIIKINNTELFAEMTPEVKQVIADTYKFPICVPYFCKFEDAMTRLTSEYSSAGIKAIGLNNDTTKGFYEVKIKGEPMRLISANASNNIICFDTFLKEGLH